MRLIFEKIFPGSRRILMFQPFHIKPGLPTKSAQTHIFWLETKNGTNRQTEGDMARGKNGCKGLNRLVEKFRNEFKRPENTKFYSEKDYKAAERKYVKLCLQGKSES
jgi:hypothetical protein